jgi:hypothetical protein
MNERETPMTDAVCERLALKPQSQYRDLKALEELAGKLEKMCAEFEAAFKSRYYPCKKTCKDPRCAALRKYAEMKKELLG